MRLTLAAAKLVIASWKTEREAVARSVHPAVEPATVGGAYLVSLVALRFAGGRLGALPLAPFSQLNVRTYVSYEGEPAVFFLRAYVTLAGLGGALLGAPLRAARVRVRAGRVDAPGPGVRLLFGVGEPAEPGELCEQELGLYEAAGLRSFRITRRAAEWRRAEPVDDPRADVLLALGFDPRARPSVFYGRNAFFEVELPSPVAESPRSRASRSRR